MTYMILFKRGWCTLSALIVGKLQHQELQGVSRGAAWRPRVANGDARTSLPSFLPSPLCFSRPAVCSLTALWAIEYFSPAACYAALGGERRSTRGGISRRGEALQRPLLVWVTGGALETASCCDSEWGVVTEGPLCAVRRFWSAGGETVILGDRIWDRYRAGFARFCDPDTPNRVSRRKVASAKSARVQCCISPPARISRWFLSFAASRSWASQGYAEGYPISMAVVRTG